MRALPLLTALALASPASAQDVVRRALVVGANDGGSGVERLRWAEDDARRMAEVLETLGGADVTVLTAPTAGALADAIARLSVPVPDDADSLFLFYYSGHADALGLRLGGEVLGWDALKGAIRDVPADVHIGIVDACRSGAITRIKGAHVEAPFLVAEGLPAEGEAWIAASAAHEDAQESDFFQGSFFTHYLLSGLRGAADSGDGWVSLDEAYRYAYERTVARTAGTQAGTQHPAYDFRLQGNGDLGLTEVRRATAHLTFPVGIDGEITILREPDNAPIAEVAKVDDRAVTIALEPGRYHVRRRVGGELHDVRVSLSEGASLTIDRWGDPKTGELAQRKGGPVVTDDADAITIRIPKSFDVRGFDFDLDLDLSPRPGLAGLASGLLPGAGQAWEGRWGDAALFLLASSALNGGGWVGAVFSHPEQPAFSSVTGPNPFTLAGMAVYGWGIADAAYGARRREAFRPRRGATVSLETVWNHHPAIPWSSGLSADVVVVPGLSVGVDRTGYVGFRDGSGAIRTGGRVTVGPELERLRPAVFGAVGMRAKHDADWNELASTPVFGGGVQLKWYTTPRYFLAYEGRAEWDGDVVRVTNGGGFGVHVGGRVRDPEIVEPG